MTEWNHSDAAQHATFLFHSLAVGAGSVWLPIPYGGGRHEKWQVVTRSEERTIWSGCLDSHWHICSNWTVNLVSILHALDELIPWAKTAMQWYTDPNHSRIGRPLRLSIANVQSYTQQMWKDANPAVAFEDENMEISGGPWWCAQWSQIRPPRQKSNPLSDMENGSMGGRWVNDFSTNIERKLQWNKKMFSTHV